MKKTTDIIIVGGGLNGPLLSLALADAGLRTIVLDAASPPQTDDFDGRSFALANGSVRMLRRLGLWDRLEGSAQPINEIKVSDGRAGEGPSPFFMHFEGTDLDDGPMGHMVEARHLIAALVEAMQTAGNPILFDERVERQEAGVADMRVATQSGLTVDGALAVGADGRHSATAQRAGIERIGWDYDQLAIVCAVEHRLPHHGIAHQFFMPGGPLAILPLTQNRSSIVWSEEAGRASALMAKDDPAFLDALRPAFGSFLGDIALTGKRGAYPLSLSLATRFVADRVALVGDAAHGIHPIAGQGLNAGLRDVATLAEILGDARKRGEDIGAPGALLAYQRARRFDTATLALATDTFNRLFSNDNAVIRAARTIGMGLIGQLPSARRGFVKEAAGLTGDLPRLMQP